MRVTKLAERTEGWEVDPEDERFEKFVTSVFIGAAVLILGWCAWAIVR